MSRRVLKSKLSTDELLHECINNDVSEKNTEKTLARNRCCGVAILIYSKVRFKLDLIQFINELDILFQSSAIFNKKNNKQAIM